MKRPELTNLSTKACRLLRPTVLAGLLAGALVLGGGLAWAQAGFQTGGSVIGDEVMYSIGGGSAVSMGRAAGMRVLGFARDVSAQALEAAGAEVFVEMAEVPTLLGLDGTL